MTLALVLEFVFAVALLSVAAIGVAHLWFRHWPVERVDKFGYPAPTRASGHWPQTVHVFHHVRVEHHVVADEAPQVVRGWIDGAAATHLALPPGDDGRGVQR